MLAPFKLTCATLTPPLLVRNIPEDQIKKQPRPVVIDRDLLSPPSCRLFASGRSPVIFFSGATDWASADPKLSKRAGALSGAGAHLQPLEPGMFSSFQRARLRSMHSDAHPLLQTRPLQHELCVGMPKSDI